MKHLKRWMPTILFTIGGALVGLVLHYLAGFTTGGGIAATDLVSSMTYMAIAGMLLSGLIFKEDNKCNT